jgi:lysophospholipase L1-like esterase
VEEKIKKTLTDSSDHRDENGYEPTNEVVNQSHFTTKEEAEAWSAEHDLIVPTITDENRRTLSSILAYCSANNIELTVISIPAPNTFDIYEYKDYLALTDTVDEICSDAGQRFYNFNLLDKDQLSIPIEGFKDVGHTNSKGAAIFSAFLAEFLKDEAHFQ